MPCSKCDGFLPQLCVQGRGRRRSTPCSRRCPAAATTGAATRPRRTSTSRSRRSRPAATASSRPTTDRQTYAPDRHLRGLLPDALLDAYAFWRNADDASLCGYARAAPADAVVVVALDGAAARPRVVVTRRRVEPGAGGPDDAPPLPDAYGGLAVAQGAPRTLLRVGGHGGHDVAARLDAAAQVLVWLAPVARGALAVDAVELDARRPRERPSSTHSAHSRGIDSSSICFTVDGRVGRVDGLDFEEVFCYVSDEDSSMEGLALYEYGIEMYWVDRKRDALCGAELECNDYWAVSEGFDEPIDVAVDERAAALYVADHTGIYKMDQVGSDLVLSAADAGLWTST